MRFAWTKSVAAVSAALIFASLGLAACQKPPAPVAAADPAVETAFFEKNAKEPGVIVLPSGVQYKIEHAGPGAGANPGPRDEVKVNYELRLIQGDGGAVIDSSYDRGTPNVFGLDAVIPGWREALMHMKVGDIWTIYVPSRLGYGPQGRGPIPGNAALKFKVELLGVLPA